MKTKMNTKTVAFTIFVFFIFIVITDGLFSKPGLQQVDLVKHKKKEEERKKKEKKSKYVVTNDNLDKIEVPKKPYGFIKVKDKDESKKTLEDQSIASTEGNSPDQEGKSGAEAGSAAEASQRDKREYWQDQKRTLLIQINDLKVSIDKNQTELNSKEYQWSAIDDPIKSNEAREKVEELKKLIPEQKNELETLEKKLEDLEERARKEGIPPGWLRVDDLNEEPPAGKEKKKTVSNG